MSTFTIIKTDKISHKWSILKFSDYLECYENTKKSYYIYSSTFTSNTKYKDHFRAKLILKNTLDKDYLACYLCGDELPKPVTVKYTFYLLTNENTKYNEKTLVLPGIKTLDNGLGFHSFIEISELLVKSKELLPYDTLTIVCDLTVYAESNYPFPVYEPNIQFLLSDQLKNLLESQSISDFTFNIDGKELKVHKFILMVRSPVFQAMFENEMIEKKTNQANIVDISFKVFEAMIKYIYTDKFVKADFTDSDIAELLSAAEKYQLHDLKELCGKILYDSLEIENSEEYLSLAQLYNIKNLKNNVRKFIECVKKNS